MYSLIVNNLQLNNLFNDTYYVSEIETSLQNFEL